MAQKVLYFTVGSQPTSGELADIANLNAASQAQYETEVVNGAEITGSEYGEDRLIPCDLVAGTVPAAYNAKTTIDPDAIPNFPLLDTQAVVSDGQAIDLDSSLGTATLSISSFGIIGAVLALPATKAVVINTQVINTSDGGTVTLTIAAGVISSAVYAGP